MDRRNVKDREIRTEDQVYEAKISEPIQFFKSVLDCEKNLEKSSNSSENADMRNVSRIREVFRED